MNSPKKSASSVTAPAEKKASPQKQSADAAVFWHDMNRTADLLNNALQAETRRIQTKNPNEDRQTAGSVATVMELRGLLSQIERLKQIKRQSQQQQQPQQIVEKQQQSTKQQQQQQEQQQQSQQGNHQEQRKQLEQKEQQQQPESQQQQQQQPPPQQLVNLTPERQQAVSAEINRILRVLDALQRRGLQHHVAMSAAEIANLGDAIRRMNPSALTCGDFRLLTDVRELVSTVGGKLAQEMKQRQNLQTSARTLARPASSSELQPQASPATPQRQPVPPAAASDAPSSRQLSNQIAYVIKELHNLNAMSPSSDQFSSRKEREALIRDLKTVTPDNVTEIDWLHIQKLGAELKKFRDNRGKRPTNGAAAAAAGSESGQDAESELWRQLQQPQPQFESDQPQTLPPSPEAPTSVADSPTSEKVNFKNPAAAEQQAKHHEPRSCLKPSVRWTASNPQAVQTVSNKEIKPKSRSALRHFLQKIGGSSGNGAGKTGSSGRRASRTPRTQSAARRMFSRMFGGGSGSGDKHRRRRHRSRRLSSSGSPSSGSSSDSSDGSIRRHRQRSHSRHRRRDRRQQHSERRKRQQQRRKSCSRSRRPASRNCAEPASVGDASTSSSYSYSVTPDSSTTSSSSSSGGGGGGRGSGGRRRRHRHHHHHQRPINLLDMRETLMRLTDCCECQQRMRNSGGGGGGSGGGSGGSGGRPDDDMNSLAAVMVRMHGLDKESPG